MTFLYTATEKFDNTYNKDGMSWEKYIEWSKLTHLTEVVSLDRLLNDTLVELDYNNGDDWNFIHVSGQYQTSFYTSLDFVLKRLRPTNKFNLLTVVLEPGKDCKKLDIGGYEFLGYELLDREFGTSPL